MPTSIRRSALHVLLILACVSLVTASGVAQTSAATPAAQTQPAGSSAEDDRIKELTERIIALEGEVRMLQQQAKQGAALTTQAPATQAAATGTAPESTSEAAAQGENQ